MRRVFATRPKRQNSGWIERLELAGYHVVEAPLLDIKEADSKHHALAVSRVLNLDEYQKVIFVSQNAVETGCKLIDQYWTQLPISTQWFAVGKRTAEQLQTQLAYMDSDSPIVTGGGAMNSESLLAMTELTEVNDEKVLIFRGIGGRPTLADVLEQRGAKVDYCELYERALPEACRDQIEQAQIGCDDIVPVFSAESLGNFVSVCESIQCQSYRNVCLVVPGDRVAKIARDDYQFTDIVVAENATEDAMLSEFHNK